ncbi:hypothetical protein NU08_1478 [Flavobacterium anhuiense]|uniref:Uncharacterized protein n=1 Tax=Flavobacterium anhuiense TaxID=459526 RepID=A0A444W1Q2_9FLAO|nr:hypothetical protein NU08_1478 [Flavobacterium anhuiense]
MLQIKSIVVDFKICENHFNLWLLIWFHADLADLCRLK